MASDLYDDIEIERLHLDLSNPRFGLLAAQTSEEALAMLATSANLKELWSSIAASGFLRFEPLIAIPHPELADEYVVIEGNRRLAACKTLLEPELLGPTGARRVPAITKAVRASMTKLPVALVRDRNEANAYIGFKHVNGPSTWSSIAKARFGIKMLEDTTDGRSRQERMQDLTLKLGDSRGLLLRIFVAYKIYEQAIDLDIAQAVSFDGPKVQFSHLYTMLNNPPTRAFLGLPTGPLSENSVKDNPIDEDNIDRLTELFNWLFGDRSVIRSQGKDRPTLQKVIASNEGLEALRSTGDLEYAATVAGLDADDWNRNLSECIHRAKMVDNDVIEILPRLSEDDIKSALERIRQGIANLRAASQKIADTDK
jgi:hypothetical protein